MSKGEKIPRQEAIFQARKMVNHLQGVCQRVEIAGSLRRGKPMVSDIEIVCIPNMVQDLFGNASYLWNDIRDALAIYPMLKGGDHYQQYDLSCCKADVYVTTLEQWGVIFTLRTGSAAFSRKLVSPANYHGYMPEGMYIEGGRLWKAGVSLDTPEEEDLFNEMGLVWIPPEKR